MEKQKRVKKQQDVVVVEEIKKKGRKPKGAKIIVLEKEQEPTTQPLSNIILHLKCSTKEYLEYINNVAVQNELQYNPNLPIVDIVSYNSDKQMTIGSVFDEDNININNQAYACNKLEYCKSCSEKIDDKNTTINTKEISDKDINAKLRLLSTSLKNASDKKSACFWCTYEFDNPTCYIPKYETEGFIYVYGAFCRPECAVAYLMKETMDDSMKFERLHLLNHIYGKIYGYTKNIKPAPDPHYILDKFFGTMTIQEYRKMLKTNHMFVTIDKPLARLMPEIYEETDEGIINAGKPVIYKVRRQSEQVSGLSKLNIVKNVFGLDNK